MTIQDIIVTAITCLLVFSICKWALNCIARHKQHTFIYCPRCNNEMIKNGRYIGVHKGLAIYECNRCGDITHWLFETPAPILITCADCQHIEFDNCGQVCCEYEDQCTPDNFYKFEPKRESEKGG